MEPGDESSSDSVSSEDNKEALFSLERGMPLVRL